MAIRITQSQLELLQPMAINSYISELMEHYNNNFPYLEKNLGKERLKEILAQCLEKAELKGFTERGPVKFYIDMFVVFGFEFETDPQYAWLSDCILRNNDISEFEQAEMVYLKCSEYFKETFGEEGQYKQALLDKLKSFDIQNYSLDKQHFEEHLINIFKDLHPQKVEILGVDTLNALIKKGMYQAYTTYNYHRIDHNALYIILMYLYGHEFDRDPFLPSVMLISNEKQTSIGSDVSEKITSQLLNYITQPAILARLYS